MTYKRTLRAVAAAFLVLSLSGCVKLDIALTVKSDDRVTGTVISGLSNEAVRQLGGETEVRRQISTNLLRSGIPAEIKVENYSDSEFVGIKLSATDVALAELRTISLAGRTADVIKHEGEKFIVDTVIPLKQGFEGVPAALANTADIKIKITFPGKVLSTNGELSGTTVTWIGRIGEDLVLKAESEETGAELVSDSGGSNLVPILLGLGALAAAGLGGFYLYNRRRRSEAMPAEWSGESGESGESGASPDTNPDQVDEDATPPAGQRWVGGAADKSATD